MADIDSTENAHATPAHQGGPADEDRLCGGGLFQASSAAIGGLVGLPVWWVWANLTQLVGQREAPYASWLPGLLVAAVLTNIVIGGLVAWVSVGHAGTVWLRRTVATLSAGAWTFGAVAIVLALCALG